MNREQELRKKPFKKSLQGKEKMNINMNKFDLLKTRKSMGFWKREYYEIKNNTQNKISLMFLILGWLGIILFNFNILRLSIYLLFLYIIFFILSLIFLIIGMVKENGKK